MRAGRLDRQVTLEVKVIGSPAPSGAETVSWSTVGTFWMEKRDVRANERFAAQQVVAEIDAVFKTRWQVLWDAIRPDSHRLVDRGRAYDILGITELGRQDAIEIACAARGEARYGN